MLTHRKAAGVHTPFLLAAVIFLRILLVFNCNSVSISPQVQTKRICSLHPAAAMPASRAWNVLLILLMQMLMKHQQPQMSKSLQLGPKGKRAPLCG